MNKQDCENVAQSGQSYYHAQSLKDRQFLQQLAKSPFAYFFCDRSKKVAEKESSAIQVRKTFEECSGELTQLSDRHPRCPSLTPQRSMPD